MVQDAACFKIDIPNGNQDDDTTHIPNWNQLRALIHKEDFIYIADCKLCSNNNLAHIDGNNGYFITIIPKNHNESKTFMDDIKTNDVKWEDAFEIRHSRKKQQVNKYRTYEAGKNKTGYRVIWVHSSSKDQDEKNRRRKKIEKLPILPQKMNTKKPTWNNIRYFCRDIHLSQILENKVTIQVDVQGLSNPHKKVCQLLEVPNSAYKNLHDRWWLFEGT